MKTIKAKLAVWTKDKALAKAMLGALALLLILIVCLCISIHMRANIQKKYSAVVHQMEEQAYQNMIQMTQLFARVDDPKVDVRNKLIPELKAQYIAAAGINSVLVENRGEKNAVMPEKLTQAFESAFNQYATAYRTGSATGLAQADMAACIEEVQQMIQLRYPPEVDDKTKDVVVIDASSGEIQNP